MNDYTLPLHKRISGIAITDMEPEWGEVNGKTVKICLNCPQPIPKSNRKYCSIKCSNEFFAKHNQQGLADLVFKRENGRCQRCGHTNEIPNVEYPAMPGYNKNGYKAHRADMEKYYAKMAEYRKVVEEWRKKHPYRDFIADHVVPIALGGAEFDLDNVQLLCEVCNRKKTKKDKARIANMRRYGKNFGVFWRKCLPQRGILSFNIR